MGEVHEIDGAPRRTISSVKERASMTSLHLYGGNQLRNSQKSLTSYLIHEKTKTWKKNNMYSKYMIYQISREINNLSPFFGGPNNFPTPVIFGFKLSLGIAKDYVNADWLQTNQF